MWPSRGGYSCVWAVDGKWSSCLPRRKFQPSSSVSNVSLYFNQRRCRWRSWLPEVRSIWAIQQPWHGTKGQVSHLHPTRSHGWGHCISSWDWASWCLERNTASIRRQIINDTQRLQNEPGSSVAIEWIFADCLHWHLSNATFTQYHLQSGVQITTGRRATAAVQGILLIIKKQQGQEMSMNHLL